MVPRKSPQMLAKHDEWDEDELSDGQMKRLLRKAEQRLHENAGPSTHDTEAVALQRYLAI